MPRFLAKRLEASLASHDEALAFLEAHALTRNGIGPIDLHFRTFTSFADPALHWTREKSLARGAENPALAYEANR